MEAGEKECGGILVVILGRGMQSESTTRTTTQAEAFGLVDAAPPTRNPIHDLDRRYHPRKPAARDWQKPAAFRQPAVERKGRNEPAAAR